MEREKMLFNPQLADKSRLDRPVLTNRIDGRPAWKDVYPEWWAGATIASPHLKAALAADKTLRRIRVLVEAVERGDEKAINLLNEGYRQQTNSCRLALLRVLQTNNADVVLETNGTSAISLVRNMLDIREGEEILTTNEEGNVVLPALLGQDPWKFPQMFEENVRLFTRHEPNSTDSLNGTNTNICVVKMFKDNDEWKTNSQVLKEVEENLNDGRIRFVVIPQVTKTGRILPVREIGELIKNINERAKRQIIYMVDGVQAVGRTSANAICKPLQYCDFYIVTSSKALGGILAAAGIVAKPETLKENLPRLLSSAYARHLRHYQFPEGYQDVEDLLAKNSEHQAISLPEISSFSCALEDLYTRGEGKTFEERRNSELKRIQEVREKIVGGLSGIKGIRIYEGDKGTPIVPSIITFTHRDVNAKEIKTALQDFRLGPIVTLSANVGRLMRVEIPEYRQVPNVETLITKVQKIVGR